MKKLLKLSLKMCCIMCKTTNTKKDTKLKKGSYDKKFFRGRK